ncbi:class I SAM-dependent methyltransferase [Gimesia aquarii]|uniref:Uncharacterized protein n=1 Tax=Gimesia aquarii TaxID=2527964 RepID=A0A517X1P5_9PLAN|nr:class I SAM-dependent methyltransferase [Gimesia aquarii]QDU11420.1 hypothetical protein V202x_48420 [Gimesia aquarii]
MPSYSFITVTDYAFFPGTLATVNSVLHYHPDSSIHVIVNENNPLTAPQMECLKTDDHVKLISSQELEKNSRFINAWELKAYACEDLCEGYDVVIGIDSDCLLCSNVDDVIERCHQSGGFLGGADGTGTDYGIKYQIYGIDAPVHNPKYMSTSLFFCAVTDENQRILKQWSECCNAAEFNGQGSHPGHGDQGVLNAILFAEGRTQDIELLPNHLWSQHWVYWNSIISFLGNQFINCSQEDAPQRSFHCGGAEKYWSKSHRERIFNGYALQTYPYVWFLTMFWFGKCSHWKMDPFQYLPEASHHLVQDLIDFLPQIIQLYPESRILWEELEEPILERIVNGVHRILSLGGGSMSEVIELVKNNPGIKRYAEVGSYEGGSIMTLGVRFANRDLDFYSVESFMGNLDGTMDGHQLPSRSRYLETLSRFPSVRVKLIPGDSRYAVNLFDNASLDFVFVDACHESQAVLCDIGVWMQKIKPGGIIAGDDYDWDSVKVAVHEKFNEVQSTPTGQVWWTRIT